MSLITHQGPSRSLTLEHVDKPELYRNLFPYTSICRTSFDGVQLLPQPPERMMITDTTFRDGQQARPPYTVQQIARMYDMLHKLGGRSGLINATEFFIYSAKDRK